MNSEILIEDISRLVKKSIQENVIVGNDTSAIFYDLDFIDDRLEEIVSSFPKNSIHALAIKANPLIKILEALQKKGIGLETASLPELTLALNLGIPTDKIVFDSPIKTREEIVFALQSSVHINIDSLQELVRIADIKNKVNSKSTIGLRINPQIGKGTIVSTSVADHISKFGIPLKNNKQLIIDSFLKYEWLSCLHVHIGSQGMSPNLIIEGIKRVFNLAEEINIVLEKSSRDNRVDTIDIGGGFPVKYKGSDQNYSFKKFAKKIKKEVPELFIKDYKIITEYGRAVFANGAWAMSKVEYVKKENDSNILMTHLGADFLLRKAYNPKDWYHKISVLDSHGNKKDNGKIEKYSIAGPLCFSGDFIARDISLPKVEEGDYIIIHDVGAYTLSMWSKYNSRQVPKIIGYRQKNIEILKERESVETTLKFWT